MTLLRAPAFPEEDVRRRAREGAQAAFPPIADYGTAVFGASAVPPRDGIDACRIVPPVLMPSRQAKLTELGREPLFTDVSLETDIGGFAAPLPVFVSALGSTRAADVAVAVAEQAGCLGLPMVIGENVSPMNGFRPTGECKTLLERITAYADHVPDGVGGVIVQQSTEDANAEVWNSVYSEPAVLGLLETGRLAFELKLGQGAKPGLGGLTIVDEGTSRRVEDQYAMEPMAASGLVLRCSSPGTFTEEILRQQIHLMRNNYPRAMRWVKLPPGRDVGSAATIAWHAGADAVTVDGADGGTGWAPTVFVDQVGLPLLECLRRIGKPAGVLLATGRMCDGARMAKTLALGARAAGLGRAALIAVDEDQERGLIRLVESLALELQLLASAVGRYAVNELGPEDLWQPGPADKAY